MLLALILALCQVESTQGEPASGAPSEIEEIPLSLRVNRTIALGVDYLLGQQQRDGSFDLHSVQHPGGMTALVAYTLVRSGVRRSDPALLRAVAALEGVVFESNYSAAVHLLLCEALNDEAHREAAARSLEFLLEHQERGVWAYPWDHLCNSNTQFALLGLRAARRMGLEVSEGVLLEALGGLGIFERRDGGFSYSPRMKESYAGMTAATLASFAVLTEAGGDSSKLRQAVGRESRTIEAAERWMERNFDPARNRYDDGTWRTAAHYAYLWAVERWCSLTGRDRIAGRDWYSEGAVWLLEEQNPDGSFGRDREVEYTCFALLFLRRATMSPTDELAEIYSEIDRLRSTRVWRPRRPGPGARRLTDWMVAGPWPEKGDQPLLDDPPFDPAKLQPKEHARVARQAWRHVTLAAESWSDLDQLLDDRGDHRLWVLTTWLEVTGGTLEAPLEAQLCFEFEDGWDIWLDGQRLTRERRRTKAVAGNVNCPIRLAPGLHLLSVLLEDDEGPAAFGALLASASFGAPPEGIVESAQPTSKGKGSR